MQLTADFGSQLRSLSFNFKNLLEPQGQKQSPLNREMNHLIEIARVDQKLSGVLSTLPKTLKSMDDKIQSLIVNYGKPRV